MLKRPHYITATLVVLTTFAILNLPSQTAARIKLAIGSLFLPLFGLASTSQQLTSRAGEVLTSRTELIKENERLRRENTQLQLQSRQAEETAKENARLRQFLHWQEQSSWKNRVKLARIVLHDPANWWRAVWIDLGSRDGVRTNLPVLTADGLLVGRVATVTLTRSQVVLLGDPNCRVAVRIENDAHDTGVITANGPFDSSLLPLEYIRRDAVLKPGQTVVTSGEGEVFPPGIPVGKIVDAHPVEYGLSLEARVKPSANLSGLREVAVLFP